jgi:hypothetical protein
LLDPNATRDGLKREGNKRRPHKRRPLFLFPLPAHKHEERKRKSENVIKMPFTIFLSLPEMPL